MIGGRSFLQGPDKLFFRYLVWGIAANAAKLLQMTVAYCYSLYLSSGRDQVCHHIFFAGELNLIDAKVGSSFVSDKHCENTGHKCD